MKLENAGRQIEILRKKAGLPRKKLCKGLCSEPELRLIEKGEGRADIIFLGAMFERLGKSAERLTYILTAEEYQRVCMRDEIEEALRFGKLAKARRFFREYRKKNPANKDKVLRMYEERIKGILMLEASGNNLFHKEKILQLDKAAAYFEASITQTMELKELRNGELKRQLRAGERLLAMFEVENILLYLHVKRQQGIKEGQVELLEALYQYLEEKVQDDGLRAQFLAKVGILLGECNLEKGAYGACVKMHEKILDLNRKNGTIVCVFPLLEQVITAYRKMGKREKVELYTGYKENFERTFQEFSLPLDCVNKLYYTCRLRQYFLEGKLIAAERKWKKMKQVELADGIYENPESLSRVETGKANCDRKKFYALMERLGMDKTRYDGNLVTDEYQVLELDRDIEQHLAKRQYEEVGHELYQLEKSVDMTEKCNRQLVLGLKNREELRKKKDVTKEDIEEALGKARELLELTYHLENVEKGGQRYRRLPFRNEMYLFNQICILLREAGRMGEAIEMMEKMMHTYERAEEKKKFHFRNVYLCAMNLSRYLEESDRLKEAEKLADMSLVEKFAVGKITLVHSGYETKFDIAEKKGRAMECGMEWLQKACFWSRWYGYEKDYEKLQKGLEKAQKMNG